MAHLTFKGGEKGLSPRKVSSICLPKMHKVTQAVMLVCLLAAGAD